MNKVYEAMKGGAIPAGLEALDLKLIQHCLNVSETYELTPEGLEEVRMRAARLYSPQFINALAQSVLTHDGSLHRAIEAMVRSAEDPMERKPIAMLLTSQLWTGIRFLRKDLVDGYSPDTIGASLKRIDQFLS